MASDSLPTNVAWVSSDLEPVPRRAREAETLSIEALTRPGRVLARVEVPMVVVAANGHVGAAQREVFTLQP
jgi:hypothetical protein